MDNLNRRVAYPITFAMSLKYFPYKKFFSTTLGKGAMISAVLCTFLAYKHQVIFSSARPLQMMQDFYEKERKEHHEHLQKLEKYPQ